MKIGLIGYGTMGKLIKTLAENKNLEVAVIIDESSANLSVEELAEKLKGVDAAIDFSTAVAVKLPTAISLSPTTKPSGPAVPPVLTV